MAGTFGYELNPALLSDEEKEEIREQIKTFKTVSYTHLDVYKRKGRYAAWQ